jgi:protein TonB
MGIASRLTLLQRCLLGSVAVHAAVLTLRMADPEGFDKMFKDAGLEVVLVNARADQKPEVAKAIAQFAMSGGGEADKGRSTSPMQAEMRSVEGNAAEDNQKRLDQMQSSQNLLLAQIREQILADAARLQQGNPAATADASEVQKVRQRLKLLAEIERKVREENERPKKRFVSPATLSKVHATYYHEFKQRVEELGTRNFPQVGGRKLYGELTMSISLDRSGAVLQTQVLESTGDARLDKMAVAIVNSGAPYGKFSENMLREFQILVVVTRFKFTRDDALSTSIVSHE